MLKDELRLILHSLSVSPMKGFDKFNNKAVKLSINPSLAIRISSGRSACAPALHPMASQIHFRTFAFEIDPAFKSVLIILS